MSLCLRLSSDRDRDQTSSLLHFQLRTKEHAPQSYVSIVTPLCPYLSVYFWLVSAKIQQKSKPSPGSLEVAITRRSDSVKSRPEKKRSLMFLTLAPGRLPYNPRRMRTVIWPNYGLEDSGG